VIKSILNLNHHHLQTQPYTSFSFTMSSTPYTLLDAQTPISELIQAKPIPQAVFDTVSSEMTGYALSQHLQNFSLGLFFIDTDLVEQHPSQREVLSSYVDKLVEDFEQSQILRMEQYGVAIGLGEGWEGLKNNSGVTYRITSSSPCVDTLRGSDGGAIAQVIRGGHRTEAVRRLSQKPDMSEENYWCYLVLLPGKCSYHFYCDCYFHNILFLATNRLPYPVLMDYSCLGNIELRSQPNSVNREAFNCVQVVERLYSSMEPSTSDKITLFLKRHKEDKSKTLNEKKINGLKRLVKYKEAVPHLVRLLQGGGGVWSGDCEAVFSALVKCKVEKVRSI
jgi:hypothetical protein